MLAFDKPMGPSAYQALCALRDESPALQRCKLGHSGRLDPLAEGLLAVLIDDENKSVASLRAADKSYEVEVLFGVATDSFDSLGVVRAVRESAVRESALRELLPRWTGEVMQRCAPFSQARVNGRSLIALGHAGVEVERPARPRSIASISLQRTAIVTMGEITGEALRRVSLVRGDFRQEQLRASWRRFEGDARELSVARLTVDCSAGTFMRSLAYDLGEAMGVPAMAWTIRRTRVGGLTLDGARRLTRPWSAATAATPTPRGRPGR